MDLPPLELVCNHSWVYFATNMCDEARLVQIERCNRCQTIWYKDREEPRIVVARLEKPCGT